MTRFTVRQLLDSTAGALVRGDAASRFEGVSTDSRTLRPGELFVALSGPSFDGNDYAAAAVQADAGALLLRGAPGEPPAALAAVPADLPVVLHPDPRRALGDLASWHRSRLACPVVGITGSCGKTTTKNVLLRLLAPHRRAVGSPSSYNNDVGVPLTLLLADETTEVLVVELGTNRPGEIAALCRIARPTCGLVTNVGAAHLEGLGSIEGVAREKSALFAALPREGFAVLNADCRHAELLRLSTSARVITFSVEGEGEYDAREPWFHAGGTTFRLFGREVTTPLLGIHNIHNVLGALATCAALGLELEPVLPGVAALEGGRQRMERIDVDGVAVFDDSYNANPDSARAGVRVLAGLHGFARRVLVLGEMAELGELAPELHHAIGADAAQSGVDLLVAVGRLGRATAAGALEGGLEAGCVIHCDSTREAAQRVPDLLRPGDAVLVKGSRRMGMEEIVHQLRRGLPAREAV